MASTSRTEVPTDSTSSITSSTCRRATAAITGALAVAAVLAALIVAAPTPAGAAAPQPPADPAGAFLLHNERFTPLGRIPGAASSGHLNLNNRGQVVGFYPDDQGVIRSFVKDRRGRVTTFAVPSAAATLAAGINDRGQVAGTYLETPSTVHRRWRAGLCASPTAGSPPSTMAP